MPTLTDDGFSSFSPSPFFHPVLLHRVKALFDSPPMVNTAKVLLENERKTACQKDVERLLREAEAMSDEEAQRRVDEINSTIADK